VPIFVPGRDLCAAFYREILAPAVDVPHSAGLLGPGSDVLGHDTERSTDHDWGPRALILVAEEEREPTRQRVARALPQHFRGWPVAMGRDDMPMEPHVEVDSAADWLRSQFGFDPTARALTAADWLLMPQQRILGVVGGVVFADDTGVLAHARARLAWYPDDVWWWLVASLWQRLGQEEPFVQRTAEVGDDLGSAVIAARQARDCMRLALLLGRRYAPYSKWLGTAFARLPDPDGLGRALAAAVGATDLPAREAALGSAYEALAARFNAAYPGDPLDTSLRYFFDRPARVLGAERFARAALGVVRDPALRSLPLVGGVEHLADSTDLLSNPDLVVRLRPVYAAVDRPTSGHGR
jgi:Domain of unknown function (DUF4037)